MNHNISRRKFLAGGPALLAAATANRALGDQKRAATNTSNGPQEGPPTLALDHDPQFFLDDYLVDNRWGLEDRTKTVTRVFHPPRKVPENPVIAEDGGYVNVVRDIKTGLFRLWYQAYWDESLKPRKYTYATAYAESADGIHWKLPRIGKYPFKGTRDNNIVMLGPSGGVAECQFLVDAPERDRRGFPFLMLYSTYDPGQRGLHLIGSQDGIHWDPRSDVRIVPGFTPDTQNSIVWDPRQAKYACFTRATNLYQDGPSGPRRRIARMEHDKLWDRWPVYSENILIPDSMDSREGHDYFYGMPVKYHAGIYWGFLWPYGLVQGDIHTELAFSRDGRSFQRLADRPAMIGRGPANAWDHGMVFGSGWVDVGDEWWIYYSGTNEGHNSPACKPGIGLARLRKEGFVSLRSPAGGGVIVTRLLRWPGGKLFLNADASHGELSVRVTGYDRKPVAGFTGQASLGITRDSVRHEVQWPEGDIRSLSGQPVRLEFTLKGVVDVFSFCALAESGQT